MIEQPEAPESGSDRNRGFTLVEILVVVSMMALLATVLAATVTVVLRTAPTSEVRADDARSLQGLVTWIPEDVDAAPPSGFDTATTAWPCAGPAPVSSYNLLAISWTERTDVTNNYAATYRYEFDGSAWHINRYTCNDETTPTMVVGRQHNLTSAMPPWDDAAPPASVKMCDAQVNTAGQCPPGSEIISNTSPDVRSLKLLLTSEDGVVSTIDAAPKNPDEDLADDPYASSNATPTLSQSNYVLDMFAGDTVTLDLNATHNPSDADGDTLSVAIDSSEPMPSGITASTADPLDVTITTDAGLPTGMIGPALVLIISDPRAGWVEATVTVNIVPEVNAAPTLTLATYDLQLEPGQIVTLPLDVTHGADDANGDPLTATPLSWPSGRVVPPTNGAPTDPLDVRIEAKPAASLGPAGAPILISIDDGNLGSVVATVNVEIVAPTANNPPVVTSSDVAISMIAGETRTLFLDSSHGASDPDPGDTLAANLDTIKPQPSGITTVMQGALEVELTADPSITAGPITIPVSLEIQDVPHGDVVDVTISITIAPTPPPPSDCVLNTVSTNPGTVDRQGNAIGGAKLLKKDVTVTVEYSGSCDGLVLKYDTGNTTGLGIGTGRVFPVGSPSSIVILAKGSGGNERWLADDHILTASTTSAVTPSTISTTLTVN